MQLNYWVYNKIEPSLEVYSSAKKAPISVGDKVITYFNSSFIGLAVVEKVEVDPLDKGVEKPKTKYSVTISKQSSELKVSLDDIFLSIPEIRNTSVFGGSTYFKKSLTKISEHTFYTIKRNDVYWARTGTLTLFKHLPEVLKSNLRGTLSNSFIIKGKVEYYLLWQEVYSFLDEVRSNINFMTEISNKFNEILNENPREEDFLIYFNKFKILNLNQLDNLTLSEEWETFFGEVESWHNNISAEVKTSAKNKYINFKDLEWLQKEIL